MVLSCKFFMVLSFETETEPWISIPEKRRPIAFIVTRSLEVRKWDPTSCSGGGHSRPYGGSWRPV